MKQETIKNLEDKGFKRWTKGNMDRMYINSAQLGLICTYYKTGNISSATFGGDEISNSRARSMKGAKTFIDLNTDTVYSDDCLLAHAAADLTGFGYEAKDWDKTIKLNTAE